MTTDDRGFERDHPGTAGPTAREQAITEQAVASFASAASQRYSQVMQSLVRHLHAFVGEIRLTEAEWFHAIDFLTRAGQASGKGRLLPAGR